MGDTETFSQKVLLEVVRSVLTLVVTVGVAALVTQRLNSDQRLREDRRELLKDQMATFEKVSAMTRQSHLRLYRLYDHHNNPGRPQTEAAALLKELSQFRLELTAENPIMAARLLIYFDKETAREWTLLYEEFTKIGVLVNEVAKTGNTRANPSEDGRGVNVSEKIQDYLAHVNHLLDKCQHKIVATKEA